MSNEVKEEKVEKEVKEEVVKSKEKKESKFNAKTIGIIVGGVVLVAAIVCVLVFFVFKDNKGELSKELENAGKNFYEEFYYNQVGKDDKERADFLGKYATIGIKIDLENLARTANNKDELLNKFVNKKTGEKCNTTNTKVTIYPQDPYGQKDYKIETTIDCGFDK